MDKKVIWIICLVIIIVVLLAGAGIGTAYFLGKKIVNTPASSSSATPCVNCSGSTAPFTEMTLAEVKVSHCLQSPNGGTGNITIADLAHYAEVTSPITFTGTANVFEATFLVRLVACDGTEIKKEIVTAQSVDVGVSSPYGATLTYGSSYAGTYAYIEAYDLSAMDGSTQDLIQAPVYLK
ncbi:MAG: hypothetical protein CEN92_466 [Candidatus Berkelbacteria bacterium Licking1014_96]|uniref:Bacterial spore germination immunoglobulin-like domain-containing protein n=1 Tax=Candidatus Berkelbacteria bacterium Licking1014_96 TaxID=2017149 RepID=A0A554LC91_9BACT|nr:MAG: hypothetical protein CEN92_466 [Candidatus Berkelbacteria bacterium Licking1014_96]